MTKEEASVAGELFRSAGMKTAVDTTVLTENGRTTKYYTLAVAFPDGGGFSHYAGSEIDEEAEMWDAPLFPTTYRRMTRDWAINKLEKLIRYLKTKWGKYELLKIRECLRFLYS